MRLSKLLSAFCFSFLLLPLTAQVDFYWDVDTGCVPLRVIFTIDSSSIDVSTITSAEWDFGNDSTILVGDARPVATTFIETGLYRIELTINNGLSVSKFYNGALPALNPRFRMVQDSDLEDYSYALIPRQPIDNPEALYYFSWEHYDSDGLELKPRVTKIVDIDNPEDATDQITYPDVGTYEAYLHLRFNAPTYSCEAEYDSVIIIRDEFIVPNVYLPKTGEYYTIETRDEVVLSFQLFSRTGLKVFEQEAPGIFWDGRNSAGQELGTGVYFYIIEATQGDEEGFYTKNGFIHLFR
jgi:hypothetical protein